MLTAAIFTSGCTSYFSARDAHLAREYLTEDIEDEVIFNLIQGVNSLPFAHYDVSTIQSVVTDKLTPNVGASRAGVSSSFLPGTMITSAAHMVTRTLGLGVTAERDNAVTVNVGPIFNDPKIYEAYVNFLNLRCKAAGQILPRAKPYGAKPTKPEEAPVSTKVTTTKRKSSDGKVIDNWTKETNNTIQASEQPVRLDYRAVGFLNIPLNDGTTIQVPHTYSVQVATTEPGSNLYIPHTLKKWDNYWYYVPVEYRPEFSDLCLALIARKPKTPAGGASAAAATAQEETAKALQQLNSQLMQQNSIGTPRNP
jgi:hypothetical protein